MLHLEIRVGEPFWIGGAEFVVCKRLRSRCFVIEGRGERHEITPDKDAYIDFGKLGYVQLTAPKHVGGTRHDAVRIGFDGPRAIEVARWKPGTPRP